MGRMAERREGGLEGVGEVMAVSLLELTGRRFSRGLRMDVWDRRLVGLEDIRSLVCPVRLRIGSASIARCACTRRTPLAAT